MASVIDLFPRRPLALRPDPARRRKRVLLFLLSLLLALPALYWGYQSVHSAMLRADLRARGVRAAETLDAKGECTSRRSRYGGTERPVGCWLDVTSGFAPRKAAPCAARPPISKAGRRSSPRPRYTIRRIPIG